MSTSSLHRGDEEEELRDIADWGRSGAQNRITREKMQAGVLFPREWEGLSCA